MHSQYSIPDAMKSLKVIYSSMFIASCLNSVAQVSIVAPVWSEFMCKPADIVSGQLISANGGEQVSVRGTITDIASGELLLDVRTGVFTLRVGMNSVAASGGPLSANFSSGETGRYVRSHSKLPVGSFRFMY